MDQNQERLYAIGEVAKALDVTVDVVRTWTKEFNIQTERTKGGHRKYNQQQLDLLEQIRKWIREQNWGYADVRSKINLDVDPSPAQTTDDELLNEIKALREEMQDMKRAQNRYEAMMINNLKLSMENRRLMLEAQKPLSLVQRIKRFFGGGQKPEINLNPVFEDHLQKIIETTETAATKEHNNHKQ